MFYRVCRQHHDELDESHASTGGRGPIPAALEPPYAHGSAGGAACASGSGPRPLSSAPTFFGQRQSATVASVNSQPFRSASRPMKAALRVR